MRVGRRSSQSSGGQRTYVPGSKATPNKVNAGKMIPGTPATPSTTTTTPSSTTVTDVSMNTPKPPHAGAMSIAIFALGIGLVVASNYTRGGVDLVGLLFDPTSKANQAELTALASMVSFVVIAALLASMSDAIGGIALLFIIAMWIVWAVKNPGALNMIVNPKPKGAAKTSTPAPTLPDTPGGTTL